MVHSVPTERVTVEAKSRWILHADRCSGHGYTCLPVSETREVICEFGLNKPKGILPSPITEATGV